MKDISEQDIIFKKHFRVFFQECINEGLNPFDIGIDCLFHMGPFVLQQMSNFEELISDINTEAQYEYGTRGTETKEKYKANHKKELKEFLS